MNGTWQRRAFGGAVCAVVAAAVIFGLTVPVPATLPGISMNAPWIFRLEAAALALIVLYIVLLAIILAFHGRGFTKLGPGGVESDALAGADEANQAISDLRDVIDELSAAQLQAVAELTTRLDALETTSSRDTGWLMRRRRGSIAS